ncbi:MAG: sulfotransferase [Paraglaciecola sp.]|uniref:tetratricopeptide repeat-containing sulfotransferase family protein n=2 Tax=Paraglaciecola sp. TaxID=1920173 RepID=UPI003299F39C
MNERFKRLLTEAEQYIRDGKLSSAHLALRKVIKKSPLLPDALIVKSQLEFAELKFFQANETLCLALEHAPNEYSILDKLLILFEKQELHFKIIEVLVKLKTLKPDDLNLHYRYALSLLRIGHIAESISELEACIEQEFKDEFAFLNLGHAYKANGNFTKAAQCYNTFINRTLAQSGYGYWSLADLKNYKFTTIQVLEIQNKLKGSDGQKDTKNYGLTQLAMGNNYDKQQNFKLAFELIKEGNYNIGLNRKFGKLAFTKLVEDILKTVATSTDIRTNEEVVNPIFVIGMPRSGTTLVEQILSSHSQVIATDELPFIERTAIPLSINGNYANNLTSMPETIRQLLASSYIKQASNYIDRPCTFFIDKNPTNFLHLGLILKLFPKAKIINLIRNPLDNAFSVFKQHFSSGNDFSYKIEDISCYMQGYYDLMNHWTSCFGEKIYHQSYEELVTQPEKNIRDLLNYCELDFQESCLNFHKSKRPVLTPSSSQVRQPMSTKSINTSEPYRELMEPYASTISNLKIS